MDDAKTDWEDTQHSNDDATDGTKSYRVTETTDGTCEHCGRSGIVGVEMECEWNEYHEVYDCEELHALCRRCQR